MLLEIIMFWEMWILYKRKLGELNLWGADVNHRVLAGVFIQFYCMLGAGREVFLQCIHVLQSWKYFHLAAFKKLKTVLFLWLKHFDIALCNVFLTEWKSTYLHGQAVCSAGLDIPILRIQQRIDILFKSLLGHRREDTNTWTCSVYRPVDYEHDCYNED